MSLLMQPTDEKMNQFARKVFERHFDLDPRLDKEYDDRRKSLMFDDILYNLGYLETALRFDDEKIFANYAVWLYQLMCNLMPDLDKERVREHLTTHIQILKESSGDILSSEDASKAGIYFDRAIRAVVKAADSPGNRQQLESGTHGQIKREYLKCLIRSDTKAALAVILAAEASGIDLDEIYLDILQEVMYEVGDLWHQNKISIDKEHYCTSTTQMVLSQFYGKIFSQPRIGKTILSCCVGSELHEMGIRMVSDLFEYHGWDSVYLGAAVPTKAILHAIEENQPDLVALSVTMPQHLRHCHDILEDIKDTYPDLPVAVGGKAFALTDELWRKWRTDYFAEDALGLLRWAQETIMKIPEDN